MKRHLMMALTLTLLLWGAGAPGRQPNIVLIMTDDMGFECLSAYGSTSYKTPRLDAMAADGMRFDHCYSQSLLNLAICQAIDHSQKGTVLFSHPPPRGKVAEQSCGESSCRYSILKRSNFGKLQVLEN